VAKSSDKKFKAKERKTFETVMKSKRAGIETGDISRFIATFKYFEIHRQSKVNPVQRAGRDGAYWLH
jgi:hypothetical protein